MYIFYINGRCSSSYCCCHRNNNLKTTAVAVWTRFHITLGQPRSTDILIHTYTHIHIYNIYIYIHVQNTYLPTVYTCLPYLPTYTLCTSIYSIIYKWRSLYFYRGRTCVHVRWEA